LCRRYNGGVSITNRKRGGTRAIAEFHYPRPISPVAETDNHPLEELGWTVSGSW
jgi:hypothetical protein